VEYSYIKSRLLNDEEKRRLRISIGTELRLSGVIRHPSQRSLVRSLLELLSAPHARVNPQLLDWLLAYGTPRLIARLGASSVGARHATWMLRAIQRIRPQQLLPREYISPDYQRFQSGPHPRNALVCFTGSALRLSVPVQLFHCLAVEQFDLIIYLRDFNKQFFTQGIPGVACNQAELNAFLRSQIPMDCPIAVLSTSGGGYAAARFAEEVHADRLVMFSPPFKFKDVGAVGESAVIPAENVRIYFGSRHQSDGQYASDWARTGYASSIRWFDTKSHGTLRFLLECGQSDALFGWLLGGAELFGVLRRRPIDLLKSLAARMSWLCRGRKLDETFRGQ